MLHKKIILLFIDYMKKLFIKITLFLCLVWAGLLPLFQELYAADEKNTILVLEKIPWAKCEEVEKENQKSFNGIKTITYKCEVERGFGSIMKVMQSIIKYFTFIAGLFAVLSIVVGGIMYSMSWIGEWMKTAAKGFIVMVLQWLVLLLLSGLILNLIAPYIYK